MGGIPGLWLGPIARAGAAAWCARPKVDGFTTAEARVAELGVTMVAAWTRLLASFPEILGVVSPFDLGVFSHTIYFSTG